ncbi:MAG: hypothetical protein M3268_04910 [Acidobacteriota bacterium]|nr:hypothetical protein [Acidobacteriota bacterium]
MTLPPQGSPHYELRRRIAGCRERLRRNRAAHRESARAANGEANENSGGDSHEAADEEDGRRASRLKSIRS